MLWNCCKMVWVVLKVGHVLSVIICYYASYLEVKKLCEDLPVEVLFK